MIQPTPSHDEAATVGPRCGTNPNARLTDGDRQAVAEFKAYLGDRAAQKAPVPDTMTVNRDQLAALLAHHADVLAARWRASGVWEQVNASTSLSGHADELTAEAESPAVRELLNSILAFEAEHPAETDEERADREATERDHARGDHTYCGITCETELPTEHLRNFVLAKGYPGTAGALDELLRRAAAPAKELPGSSATLAAGMPLVQGRCPACGTEGLFLGNGGYVTCSSPDCQEPDAASTVLERQPAPVPDTGRRTRYEAAFGPNMRLGLQNAELFDQPGAQRINEWITWITDAVMAVADAELGQVRAELNQAQDDLAGACLARWEEEQDNARLRLALASARRGRREARTRIAELEGAAPPKCGRTRGISGTVYAPCDRQAGHRAAYCQSADGTAYFLAVDADQSGGDR